MDIQCLKRNKILIVKISGEIDHHACEILRNQVDNTLEKMGGKHIIFDMNNVSFMDSSGIGVVIGRYKLAQKLGGKMCMISSNKTVDKMLKFSAISKIIPVVPNVEDGINLLERSVV